MIDRGIIKWQPFDSCFSSQSIINEIVKEKEKIRMPILSDDQLEYIQDKIIDAYNLKTEVKLQYYYDGNIFEEKGKIQYINSKEKKICLNKKFIYLKQILNIN